MKKNKIIILLLLVILMISFSSCAPSGYEEKAAGFFSGLWHGMIIIFSLIGKLFGGDIGIYAEHNTGFTYWFGFIMGICGVGGGGLYTRR